MAPGREELRFGKPFVGGSGKFLWGMAAKKANISRADCYILNIIGEWPEGKNGAPTPAQLEKWWDEFDSNIAEFTGSVVVCLGGDALKRVAGDIGGISDWRGYLISQEETQPVLRRKLVKSQYKTSRRCKCFTAYKVLINPDNEYDMRSKEVGNQPDPNCAACGGSGFAIKKGDEKITYQKVWEKCPLPESVLHIAPLLHPAAILRTGFAQAPAFAADMGRVGRALRGDLRPYREEFTEGTPVDIITNPPTGPVSLDIETRMGGVDADSIERIGVASSQGTWTAVWDHTSRLGTRAALTGEGPFIFHNVGFDAPRLQREGCPVPEPWWDTMYAALLLQPDLLKGLNGVASLYLDRRRWKHLSADLPAYYNAQDVSSQLELYFALREQLRATGQLELFEGTIMPTIPVLVEMNEYGIPVDVDRRNLWVDRLEFLRGQAMGKWSLLAPGVSPLSPTQLKSHLYGNLGLPVQLSKYGGETTDEGALRELLGLQEAQQHRGLLELLLEIRDVNKQLETYAKVNLGEDNRVHPQWMPAAKDSEGFGKGLAGTGRIISRGPNAQNISPEARKMYTGSAGCVLLEADWSQIEARIIAALSGDARLAAAISSGLHAANMAALGVDKTRAKNFFYGWSYGAGARTLRRTFLAHGFDIPESECKSKLKLLEATYVRTTEWRREVADRAATTYSLSNAFGRRRNFLRGGGDTPAALDFLPQSTAADCMWAVLRPIRDSLRGIGGHILGAIHDSVLIECPRSAVEEGSRILRTEMEREFPQIGPGFFVPVEVKIGENWGEMKPYEADKLLQC